MGRMGTYNLWGRRDNLHSLLALERKQKDGETMTAFDVLMIIVWLALAFASWVIFGKHIYPLIRGLLGK